MDETPLTFFRKHEQELIRDSRFFGKKQIIVNSFKNSFFYFNILMNNLHIILLIVILALLAFVYSREKFLNFVFCNTVKNREDCISYGCEMKDIKTTDIKCIDDNKPKLNDCNIRRETNLNKLNKILESVEISNEDIYYDNKYFVPEYQNYYLRLVKPGNKFKDYLKEEDREKNYSFTF